MASRKKRRQPAQPRAATVSSQPPVPAPRLGGRSGWVVLVGLAAITFLTFRPVLENDFVSYDDRSYVTENPYVCSGLRWGGLSWGLTTLYFGNWHPLVWWSLMLDAQLYGPGGSGGFHFTNLLWHLGSTLLLFAALRRMTGALWESAFAAALFAVHPLNVEPVAWVAERKGVISTFFWMLTLWAYARYAERPGLGRYLPVVLALVLGLMAKPMLVTIPFVLLLLDFWPLGRWGRAAAPPDDSPFRPASLSRLVVEKLPLLAVSAGFSVLAVIAQGRTGALTSLESLPPGARVELAVLSYLAYLERAFCPLHLAAYYPLHVEELQPGVVAAGTAFLLALSGLFLCQVRRAPYLAVGWLWFVGTLVPVIGLVQVGRHAQADRYTYVPLVGLFIAASWSLAAAARRWHRERWAAGLSALLVGALMFLSSRQARTWKNTDALWQHALAVTKNNHVAHNNLAVELQKRGQLRPALLHYLEAVRIKPDYTLALNGKGQCLMGLGDLPGALACFREAVRCDPALATSHNNLGVALASGGAPEAAADEFREVLRLDPENADGELNLGRALLQQGRPEEAAAHLLAGVRLRGNEPSALSELGRAYQMSGDWQQAEACFRQLVDLQPQQASYHKELAFCLSHLGLSRQAEAAYRDSLRLDPRWPAADLQRAWRLATAPRPTARQGRLAVLVAEKVVEADGRQDARALDVLAAAYAESGRFDDARQTAARARRRAGAAGQTSLAAEIEGRLRLYQKGQPFHTP